MNTAEITGFLHGYCRSMDSMRHGYLQGYMVKVGAADSTGMQRRPAVEPSPSIAGSSARKVAAAPTRVAQKPPAATAPATEQTQGAMKTSPALAGRQLQPPPAPVMPPQRRQAPAKAQGAGPWGRP